MSCALTWHFSEEGKRKKEEGGRMKAGGRRGRRKKENVMRYDADRMPHEPQPICLFIHPFPYISRYIGFR